MALAIDATSPASVTTTGLTVTSASFTPPANSLIVALVGACTGATTVTDSLSSAWTLKSRENANADGDAEIWMMNAGASPAARTVTSTATTQKGILLTVVVFTGALALASQTATPVVQNTTAWQAAITTTTTGSYVVGGTGDNFSSFALTANASTTSLQVFNDVANGQTSATFRTTNTTTTPGSVTVGYSTTGTTGQPQIALLEVLPAAASATFPPFRVARRRSIPPSRRPRVMTPVRSQVNPPIAQTQFGRLRNVGRIRPPARVVTPIPPQFNPIIIPTVFGRLRTVGRVRPPARVVEPTPPQVNPPIVSTVTPGRLRRTALRLNRSSAVTGAPLGAQTATQGATMRRRFSSPSRRPRVASPQPVQTAPVAPLWVPVVARGLRAVGRTVRRGQAITPVQAQQALTPNPSITATVFGRLRSVGRVRPPSRVVKPIPPQVNPPIVSTVIGRLRSVGRVGRVRSRSANVISTQSAVVNPLITATVFGRLRSVGRVRPPARVSNPTPAQQAVAPNPKITATVFGRLRSVGRVRPPSRVVKPVPAQVNPPYPIRPSRVITFRGSSRRRGAPVSAPQVQPTAETRTIPAGGLRGLRRVWLKIRRKSVTPVPAQVTTLQGPLIITDSYGGTEADRISSTALGGVYGSAPSVGAGGTFGGFTVDPDNDNVTGTYDSDSDTL